MTKRCRVFFFFFHVVACAPFSCNLLLPSSWIVSFIPIVLCVLVVCNVVYVEYLRISSRLSISSIHILTPITDLDLLCIYCFIIEIRFFEIITASFV